MNKKQDYINYGNSTLLDSISNFKKDLSKKTIKNYIKNKMVKVNDKVITNSSQMVHEGDKIEITYTKKIIPEYKLDILYEDDYLIIIDKPSGLLSIGNDKEKEMTAYRMVSEYVKRNSSNKYIFVVHRLDQDTSGILMFCKNQKIRDKMQDNWNTIVKKRGYIAIIDGVLKGSGTYHSFLLEDRNQFVYSSKNNQGKEAITHYQVIKNKGNYSLVQVFIDTGRRNQIRVHFSEHGYPLVGDKKYRCKTNPIKRLCLHANILEFIHPVSKKLIHIESNIPDEFKKLM
ncbi:MAG: RluA family pseudouridine synthase [Bacilli bacterium]